MNTKTNKTTTAEIDWDAVDDAALMSTLDAQTDYDFEEILDLDEQATEAEELKTEQPQVDEELPDFGVEFSSMKITNGWGQLLLKTRLPTKLEDFNDDDETEEEAPAPKIYTGKKRGRPSKTIPAPVVTGPRKLWAREPA